MKGSIVKRDCGKKECGDRGMVEPQDQGQIPLDQRQTTPSLGLNWVVYIYWNTFVLISHFSFSDGECYLKSEIFKS